MDGTCLKYNNVLKTGLSSLIPVKSVTLIVTGLTSMLVTHRREGLPVAASCFSSEFIQYFETFCVKL